jgi:deoxyribodipyrimidine photo-lyase
MTASRRTSFNFGLQRAAEFSRALGLPLTVLEALRSEYRWASARLHRFILQGMSDNARTLARRGITAHPYVESNPGDGKGLLSALAEDAAVVITDSFPTFFLPRMVAAAGRTLPVRLEAVDSNGLIPLDSTESEFATAYSFRRHVQKTILGHLEHLPLEDPLAEDLPASAPIPEQIAQRWPRAPQDLLDCEPTAIEKLPIDHSVGATGLEGGETPGRERLRRFISTRLADYGELRNRPDDNAASGLSPYLHFGHLSAHEVVLEILRSQRWTPEDTVDPANGRRAGWWGLGDSAEGFLDQIITWRELGYQFCHHRADHEQWSSLPGWAQATLEEHAADSRDHLYSLEQLRDAQTHDPLWNAAQTQLVSEGTIHNYLRMLWGKKILEWTEHPRQALEIMLELNNRYALDGRDPNSVSGIFWVLGRHDRAWGPERPIFGKVRYMSSQNTARKVPVKRYLEEYGPQRRLM